MLPSYLGFDHIHVYVTDRAAAAKWYASILGFTPVTELASWAADGGPLTLADASHQVHLALFERAPQACRSTIALKVTAEQLLAWHQHLQAVLDLPADKDIKLVDHQFSWSIYFSDPYGNPYEITSYDYAEVAEHVSQTK